MAAAMEPLANLVSETITPEAARVNKPVYRRLDAVLPIQGTEPAAFQAEVFNSLLAQNAQLGIRDVWSCGSVRIDGLVDLVDGSRLALEIKYRMNWEKACQACHQIGWFRNHPEAETRPITGGLVVFEEFARDWARRSPSRLLENGWNYWYTDHQQVEGLPVHLVRLRRGAFESYPMALAAASKTPVT
jgi:hypothetical protein